MRTQSDILVMPCPMEPHNIIFVVDVYIKNDLVSFILETRVHSPEGSKWFTHALMLNTKMNESDAKKLRHLFLLVNNVFYKLKVFRGTSFENPITKSWDSIISWLGNAIATYQQSALV